MKDDCWYEKGVKQEIKKAKAFLWGEMHVPQAQEAPLYLKTERAERATE